jgi:hypothetical protein
MVILVLSVATFILYVDNKRTRDCIADYMTADQEASSARFEVGEEERQSFKNTLRTIAAAKDGDSRKVILEYVELLDKNDAIRKANPILPVPTECS